MLQLLYEFEFGKCGIQSISLNLSNLYESDFDVSDGFRAIIGEVHRDQDDFSRGVATLVEFAPEGDGS